LTKNFQAFVYSLIEVGKVFPLIFLTSVF